MAEAGTAMNVTARPRTPRSSAWWLLLVVGAVGMLVSRLLPDGMPRSIAFALYGPIAAAGISSTAASALPVMSTCGTYSRANTPRISGNR